MPIVPSRWSLSTLRYGKQYRGSALYLTKGVMPERALPGEISSGYGMMDGLVNAQLGGPDLRGGYLDRAEGDA
jgi:hypothetical protein